jgi:hypothetical protein
VERPTEKPVEALFSDFVGNGVIISGVISSFTEQPIRIKKK